MNILTLPLSEIKRPERNIRIHGEKQLKEFERSIRMFGQIRPIVIDENNIILAGNGCFETLLRMGYTEGGFFRMENLTENQKKKLMIADNKIYTIGIDDIDTFNSFLEELQSDLDIPGFDEEILRSMVAAADEVTAQIAQFGIMTSEEINAVDLAREKKELTISKPDVLTADSRQEDQRVEPVETRRSVICPKCGEEIWL